MEAQSKQASEAPRPDDADSKDPIKESKDEGKGDKSKDAAFPYNWVMHTSTPAEK